jgi:hypothetical protein
MKLKSTLIGKWLLDRISVDQNSCFSVDQNVLQLWSVNRKSYFLVFVVWIQSTGEQGFDNLGWGSGVSKNCCFLGIRENLKLAKNKKWKKNKTKVYLKSLECYFLRIEKIMTVTLWNFVNISLYMKRSTSCLWTTYVHLRNSQSCFCKL